MMYRASLSDEGGTMFLLLLGSTALPEAGTKCHAPYENLTPAVSTKHSKKVAEGSLFLMFLKHLKGICFLLPGTVHSDTWKPKSFWHLLHL